MKYSSNSSSFTVILIASLSLVRAEDMPEKSRSYLAPYWPRLHSRHPHNSVPRSYFKSNEPQTGYCGDDPYDLYHRLAQAKCRRKVSNFL